MTTFNCQRCGYCCSHLLTRDGNWTFGLYLTPEEKKYFPDAVPLLIENECVLAYQVGQQVCPHLTYDGEGRSKCSIHDHRPLGCRVFPVTDQVHIRTDLCPYVYPDCAFQDEIEALAEMQMQAALLPPATVVVSLNTV